MYQRILVPTDGTELSKKAIASAVELAKAVGAEVVALHVVRRYPMSYFDGALTISADEIARVEKKWSDRGQELVDEVSAAGTKAGVKVKGVVLRSDLVADAILSAVRKNECDLVVMASHGRKGIQRVLLGSETQQVLTHAEVPVLVLR